MNRCSPPASATSSSPGRKCRWYALPRMIWAPSARTSSGVTLFTVAFVPTGMKTGVCTSPCAVRSTPARAAPSVAVTSKADMSRCQAPLRVCNGLSTGSEDEHRVAEGIEAVARLDREPVQPARLLDAGECHHQREQRRAREVEVRQQVV